MPTFTEAFLPEGAVRLLDGGVGTELQRRGVPMASQAWCGPAALDQSEALEGVHRDYIDAGADIITANTYATARHLLALEGLGEEFATINTATVRAARKARDACGRPDVRIAGSLSHRGAIAENTAEPDPQRVRSTSEMAASLRELAVLLREEGCDLILLEMLYDPVQVPVVLDAAAASGLPIWAGFSARRGQDGQVLGFGPTADTPLEDLVALLSRHPVEAAGIMHTSSDLIGDAVSVLRRHFDGPLMAYPDAGYFKSPHWQFENVIAPSDLYAFAAGWVADGVQVVGGCCGLGPEHIAALAPLRRPV